MEATKFKKIEPVAYFKERVAACKPFPPGLRDFIFNKFPEYDSADGSKYVERVLNLRSSDVSLTEIIERACQECVIQFNKV